MRARVVALVFMSLVSAPLSALAADELIDDPELAARTGEKPRKTPAKPPAKPAKKKKPPAPTNVTLEEEVELPETPEASAEPEAGEAAGTAVGATDGEQVIDDPELAGASGQKNDGSFGDLSGPREPRWNLTFHSRWGYATQQDGRDRQDIVEGTTIGIFEVEQRRSDELLLSVGLRFRHAFAKPKTGAPGYDLDIAPLSAFADLTPTPGFHIRAGYQVIHMGRFDSFTQTNFLAVYDLRSGPVTMPEASAIAQPALRFDVDAIEGWTFQAFYIPFFTPNLYPVYGSNYAALDRISAISDQYKGLLSNLDAVFIRSKLARASTSFAQAFAPAPDLLKPQGALRITHSGSAGEISLTAGTALDRLPTRIGFTLQPSGLPEITVAHDRFYVASMDGALDVGPFQLGAELAYIKDKTLSAIGTYVPDGTNADYPIRPGKVDLVQGALRAELVEVAGWSGAIEMFILSTLGDPDTRPDPDRTWLRLPRWFGMEGGRLQRGVSGGVQYAPENAGWRIELAGALLTGPSYVISPRIEFEPLTRFYMELGGVFVGGPFPTSPGSPNVALAGLYGDIDQVYLGLRWMP
jgi:hypothetical protein